MLCLLCRQGNVRGYQRVLPRKPVLTTTVLIVSFFAVFQLARAEAQFETHIDSTIYKLATEHNDRSAQYLLGKKYLLGKSVERNMAEAIKWLELAAAQNHKKAQYSLGKMYLYGEGVAANYIYALDYLSKAANANHVGAQFELGNYYAMGVVGPKNYQKAVKWYREAVDRQFAPAMSALGKILYEGSGDVRQQTIEARKLLQAAADAGETDAVEYLRNAKQNGNVIAATGSSAPQPTLSDLEIRAQKGDSNAQFELGTAYLNGELLRKDTLAAAKWFRMAANESHPDAQYQLAIMYRDGVGVARDPGKSNYWMKAAAKAGHLLALRQNLDDSNPFTDAGIGSQAQADLDPAPSLTAGSRLNPAEMNTPDLQSASLNPALDPEPVDVKKADSDPRLDSNPDIQNQLDRSLNTLSTDSAIDRDGPSRPDAQFALGMNHLNGIGVDRNRNLAVSWLTKAASQNYARAQFALGQLYFSGEHFPINTTKAKEWLIKAADNGHVEANLLLQDMLNGVATAPDSKTTDVALTKTDKPGADIAQQNPAVAPLIQTATLDPDIGMDPSLQRTSTDAANFDRAPSQPSTQSIGPATLEPGIALDPVSTPVQKLSTQRSSREAFTQTTLESTNRRPSPSVAAAAANQAAAPSAPPTQVAFNTPPNNLPPISNVKLPDAELQRAERGDSQSQFKIGMIYILGKGKRTSQDKQQGIKWLTKAADSDYLEAQLKLAELYYNGEDIGQNFSAAAKWYEKAALTGDSDAQYTIGNMYKEGLGVQRDNSKAIKWLRKAANQGHHMAKKSLGGCRIC